jgi:hypothetical protein
MPHSLANPPSEALDMSQLRFRDDHLVDAASRDRCNGGTVAESQKRAEGKGAATLFRRAEVFDPVTRWVD